jgi:hypothetical protein
MSELSPAHTYALTGMLTRILEQPVWHKVERSIVVMAVQRQAE